MLICFWINPTPSPSPLEKQSSFKNKFMTSLKHQLFSGVFYTALAKYSGILVSLVVAGVLARLISPDDFGVMAVATVIIAFFNLFTDYSKPLWAMRQL